MVGRGGASGVVGRVGYIVLQGGLYSTFLGVTCVGIADEFRGSESNPPPPYSTRTQSNCTPPHSPALLPANSTYAYTALILTHTTSTYHSPTYHCPPPTAHLPPPTSRLSPPATHRLPHSPSSLPPPPFTLLPSPSSLHSPPFPLLPSLSSLLPPPSHRQPAKSRGVAVSDEKWGITRRRDRIQLRLQVSYNSLQV